MHVYAGRCNAGNGCRDDGYGGWVGHGVMKGGAVGVMVVERLLEKWEESRLGIRCKVTGVKRIGVRVII